MWGKIDMHEFRKLAFLPVGKSNTKRSNRMLKYNFQLMMKAQSGSKIVCKFINYISDKE